MANSSIFLRFKENTKIEKAIKYMQVESNNYNDKINAYMITKAQQFLQYHNKSLEYKESQIYTLQFLPRYIFLVFITKTNTNHPYLFYVNLDERTLNFLLPTGKEQKQANIEDYMETISNCNISDLSAIYILLEKTIYIRKYAILNMRFNLLDCDNISNCVKKMREIDKMKISSTQKNELRTKYNTYYLDKALNILKKYFDILEAKEYEEAYLFLKSNHNNRYKSKYFGKERLDTFFKNTKNIIGHLEIFIVMYQLLHQSRMKLLKY